MTTAEYRAKYAKRRQGRYMVYPAGGADVQALCDRVEALLAIVRWAENNLPTDDLQNEAERKLWATQ